MISNHRFNFLYDKVVSVCTCSFVFLSVCAFLHVHVII